RAAAAGPVPAGFRVRGGRGGPGAAAGPARRGGGGRRPESARFLARRSAHPRAARPGGAPGAGRAGTAPNGARRGRSTGDRGRGGGPRTGWPGGRAVKFGGRGPIHLSAWSARILRFGKPACAVSFSARAFSAVITDLLDHRLLRRFT